MSPSVVKWGPWGKTSLNYRIDRRSVRLSEHRHLWCPGISLDRVRLKRKSYVPHFETVAERDDSRGQKRIPITTSGHRIGLSRLDPVLGFKLGHFVHCYTNVKWTKIGGRSKSFCVIIHQSSVRLWEHLHKLITYRYEKNGLQTIVKRDPNFYLCSLRSQWRRN